VSVRRRAAVSFAVVSALTGGVLVGAPAASAVPNGSAAGHVIVLLRNQHPDLPATHSGVAHRAAVAASDQAPLVADARAHGGTTVRQLHVVNAFAVTTSATEQSRLAANPAVAAVVPDRQVALPTSERAVPSVSARGPVSSTVCPTNPAQPLLEPEALQLTNTAFDDPNRASAQRLATGKGVRVAFLADGLDVNNPDFIRADGSHVFVDYQDFSGDGPLAPTASGEAFGDASSIAAQGRQTYDLSTFVNPAHPLPAGCNIRIRGVAPDASLVGLKVFPAGGFAFNSAILAALDYAVTVDKVDVINESFGSNQYPDTGDDPTALFNQELVASGITITASTGDSAGQNTIGSPASTAPGVISVGGTTSFRLYAQTTYNGFQLSNGSYASDNISGLSSSGVTQTGRTLDLVAPGDLGWALCSPNPDVWEDCVDNKGDPASIEAFGGTSESTPLVAGAAALVIQAYRDTHGGTTPAPALVKRLLTGTASDLGLPAGEQGAGLLDTLGAVQAARSVGASSTVTGANVITNPTQLNLTARSGGSASAAVQVTNVGRQPQLLTPSLRSVSRVLRRDEFSPTLSPTTDPTFLNQLGAARAFTTQTFQVPAGADRLTAAVAWPGTGQIVRFFLLDPRGTYTAYTIPQGVANYGFADVRNPRPGKWTAVIVTTAGAAGFAGAVDFVTTSYRSVSVGSVSPGLLVLLPGQTRTLQVRVPADDGGDVVDALQLAAPNRQVAGAVPVTVRTLVATGRAGGTFSGTFSGGNGRGGIPNPSQTYAFDVPAGRPDLAVSLTVRGNPNQAVYGFLVDPNGEAVNEQTNQTIAADGTVSYAPSLQFDHRAPQAGRWQFVFAVFGPIAGTSVTTPYSGQVRYGLADVSAPGVPNNPAVTLAAGHPVALTVTVVNRGAATGRYFADGRLAGRVDLPLAGANATGYQLAPAPVAPFPAFQIPTETNGLTVSATSDRPINFEVSPFPADHVTDLSFEGDPDVEAAPAGTSPSVTVTDPIIAPQTWLALPSQIGPFPDTAPTATVTFTATAHTQPFDPAVTSSTGDPLLGSVQQPAPATTPLTLAPGASGTVTVTVTPVGPAGHVVHGVLYLDTYDPVTGSSDEITAVPYSYTVG
jgi:Subtilase family